MYDFGEAHGPTCYHCSSWIDRVDRCSYCTHEINPTASTRLNFHADDVQKLTPCPLLICLIPKHLMQLVRSVKYVVNNVPRESEENSRQFVEQNLLGKP